MAAFRSSSCLLRAVTRPSHVWRQYRSVYGRLTPSVSALSAPRPATAHLRRLHVSAQVAAPRVAPLPVIDISPFTPEGQDAPGAEEARQEAGRQLAEACASWGAFYVSGHGISPELQRRSFERARQFFALPADVKRSIGTPPAAAAGFVRGFVGMGEESGSDRLEVKEAFSYGYDWKRDKPPTNALQGPNEWPPDEAMGGPEWRGDMLRTFDAFVGAAAGITDALSLALGLPRGELARHCTEGDTISLMRLFHYHPYSAADDPAMGAKSAAAAADSAGAGRIGSSPHTDWGWLTLILQQDDVVGLQVDHDGEWLDVPPRPGTLCVNIGDYVSLLTNGRLKSPLHRVVTGDAERLSWVFFNYPDYDASIPTAETAGAGARGGSEGVGKGTAERLSLFTDQNHGAEGSTADQADLPFGEFIRRKWASVSREV